MADCCQQETRYREILSQIMQAALKAVDPEAAVLNSVSRQGDALIVGGQHYDLSQTERIILIGGGKAGAPMAKAIAALLGNRLSACVINVKDGYTLPPEQLAAVQRNCACPLEFVEAGHPKPNQAGVTGAMRIETALQGLSPRDLVICVISGGGSALMTLPVEGVSLSDMQALTDLLLRCGATINEINTVRKHLDRLKGGNLARLAQPAKLVALLLSDVVGNPLDVIASGPTVPDSSSFAAAWAVLEKYDILQSAPEAVISYLQRGCQGIIADTPKADDPAFANVQNLVVASNDIAAAAAVKKAQSLGTNAMLLSTYVEGEAKEVAKVGAALIKEMAVNDRPLAKPACIVIGGETTVTIHGQGLGGRNQELALAGALALSGWHNVILGTLATDGSDGPTDAAGAVVSGESVARAAARGLDALAYLRNNDSYHFFKASGELLVTGPTNTNVNDLLFLLAY